jgi:hypothetical protein
MIAFWSPLLWQQKNLATESLDANFGVVTAREEEERRTKCCEISFCIQLSPVCRTLCTPRLRATTTGDHRRRGRPIRDERQRKRLFERERKDEFFGSF